MTTWFVTRHPGAIDWAQSVSKSSRSSAARCARVAARKLRISCSPAEKTSPT